MNRSIRQILFPLMAALIWGTAFSAQSVASQYVGPLTFNAARNVIAFFALLLAQLPTAGGSSEKRKVVEEPCGSLEK